MKGNICLKLKAGFLLIVFSLNTVLGFACAIGIKMWYKVSHHEKTGVLVHKGSDHCEENCNALKSKGCTDNCCNERVTKISKDDKSLPEGFACVNLKCVTSLISFFCNAGFLNIIRPCLNLRYFARSHHPPIPDLRIAIQSFQI